MKQITAFSALVTLVFLQSCVGTDLIDDPIIAERVTISPRITTLEVGKEQVFTLKYTNKYGAEETPKSIVWRSNAADKVTIDATGKAKTLVFGKVTLYATVGSATDSIVLNQSGGGGGGTTNDTTFIRRGVFKPVGGSYSAMGNVRIQTVKGVTQIVTDANFSASAGPSLYLLLANHTNGSYTVTPGSNTVNAVSAQITANKLSQVSGVLTWAVPSSVNPANYQYAVLYCTLGPVFGYAELK
jgi:Bacterial Ig-like domain (group 2)